jgi:hypothetical protein
VTDGGPGQAGHGARDSEYEFTFSRRCSPELCWISRPRGRRESQARNRTCSLACKIDQAHERSHHRLAGTPGFPRAVVLTVSFVLSPETGLCCLRHRRKISHRFSASVGAPRPHDFAVRSRAVRPSSTKTSTASRPTFVTMANAPHSGGMPEAVRVICSSA